MADPVKWANDFLDGMIAGNWDELVENFDDQMRQVMPAEGLEAAWEQLALQAGDYQSRKDASADVQEGYHVVVVPVTFAHGDLNFRVIYHPDGKIAGFHFNPAQ